MLATYPFRGRLNIDDPTLVVPQGDHVMARNGIFRGTEGRMRFESMLGTTLMPNANLPAGINATVGVKYDPVNEDSNGTSNPRVLFANYNSNGNSGWYIYYTLTGTFQTLVQDNTNTVGQVTGITSANRITGIELLYGDGVQGTLLFYVDSNQNCRKLNINRILAGGYPTIKNEYLNVIKAPPIPPIQCCYENESTASSNNLINSLFNFTCTHIYDDFEQSVLASASKQPLPSDPFNPQNNTPATRNVRIVLYIPTGDINVTKLKIYAKQTQYGATTDWFIVDTLDKRLLSIPSNTVYQYYFYNNGNYPAADPTFTVLDYDQVPQSANCQSLLDGDVISYAGITEGYDFINPIFAITASNVSFPAFSLNGTLLFASPNGIFTGSQPHFVVYLRGVGANDGFGNPTTLEKSPGTMVLRAKSNGSDISFHFNNTGSESNISNLLSDFQTAAIAAGWAFVSNPTTTSLEVYYPTGTVVLQSCFLSGQGTNTSPYSSPIACHFPQSSYSYGVLYRDGGGRTNGTISNLTGNLATQATSTGQIPEININLSAFNPPQWAVYWELVRTDTLTYNKYLNWVSNAAYQGTGAGVNTQYAYFGISNISTYNQSISATEGVVSYSFSQGDRIKILGRYDSHMNFTPLNLDYAILGIATNPVANGVFQNGTFIQIYYPSADINANFQFPIISNDTDFQNYLVLIYSYKAYATTGQNVYFQIGQQYGIGNAGTPGAFHMGNVADNQIDLTDGDVFYRSRTVPLQNSYFINTGSYDQMSPFSTDWVNPGGGHIPIVNNGIWEIIGGTNTTAGLGPTDYPTYANTDFTIQNLSVTDTLSVRLRGTQSVTDKTDPNGQFSKYVKVVQPGNVVTLTQIVPLQTGLQPNVATLVPFDSTIQLPPQAKLWLINSCVNEFLIGGYLLELDVIRNIAINVFDKSYSDIYELVTNSDNKPNVVNVEAAQTYFSTLYRFSQPDVLGTDINNSNRFYPDNFDEWDKSYGDVMRMRVRQRELRVFQKRRCGRVGVYQKFITNQSANTSLVVSDTIITQNNIQYFDGEYGIGNQIDSLGSSGYQDYFFDPVRGCYCRLSLNGIDNISQDEKVQTFAGTMTAYLNTHSYQFGGTSSVLGVFNFVKDRDSEALFFMQGGSGTSGNLQSQTIAFNERQKTCYGFFDYAPDAAICAENELILFYNGNLYIQNDIANPALIFGNQLTPSITMVFKDPAIEKKTFLSLVQVANSPWVCPNINTDTFSYGTTLQSSNLVAEDFELLGTDWVAPFWFDINSQMGQFNGDTMTGSELIVQFSASNPAIFSYLAQIGIRYIDSPLTVK